MTRICPECRRRFDGDEARCPTDGEHLLPLGNDDSRLGTALADRFLLLTVLGEGGMGVVYRAHQLSTGRPVALKVMRPPRRGIPDERKQAMIDRFRREARVTASLRSPHTVTLHDFGVLPSGELYMALEMIEGQALGDVMTEEGPMAPERVRSVLRQVCLSLEEAHARGLVHRDLKPGNIMLEHLPDGSDFARVLDFGIAKVTAEDATQLTGDNATLGTPAYMSPEQALSQPVGPQTDLYALGVIGFQMLSGHLPFQAGDTAMGAMLKHVMEQPRSLASLGLRDSPWVELDAVLMRCLEKKSADRFPSAAELRSALEGLAELTRGVAPAGASDPDDAGGGRAVLPPTETAARVPVANAATMAAAGGEAPTAVQTLPEARPATVVDRPAEPARGRPAWLWGVAGAVAAGGAAAVIAMSGGDPGPNPAPEPRAALAAAEDASSAAPVPNDASSAAPAEADTAEPKADERSAVATSDAAAAEPDVAHVAAVGAHDASASTGDAGETPAADASEPPEVEATPKPEPKPKTPRPKPKTPKPKPRPLEPKIVEPEPPRAGRVLASSIGSRTMSKSEARAPLATLKRKAVACWREAYGTAGGGDEQTVYLYVAANGAVKRVSVRPALGGTQKLATCLAPAAQGLQFPALEGEAFATVKVTVGP